MPGSAHVTVNVAPMTSKVKMNGNGELTGTLWVEESGQCEGPITITNTHSCGVARDATIGWLLDHRLYPAPPAGTSGRRR